MKKIKFAGVNFPSRSTIKWLHCYYLARKHFSKKFTNIENLVDQHFLIWSSQSDPTRDGFLKALKSISTPSFIVETGTSAWGCDSSRLFDVFVRDFGGMFHSVDIRKEASLWLKYQVSKSTSFHVSDSIEFLRSGILNFTTQKIDLLYLDSFDLDWSNPLPSAQHHLQEFLSALPLLKKGSYILIDDTPNNVQKIPTEYHSIALRFKKDFGQFPGKGSLILNEIKNYPNMKIVHHTQNLLIQIN